MKPLLALWLPLAASAAIWPDSVGEFHRTSSRPVQVSDRALWDEYGLQQAEEAEYSSADRKFTATAYRLQDSTGAMAAFEWQRPADAKPSPLGSMVAETLHAMMLAHGNYVLVFKGYRPTLGDINALYETLPALEQSSLPTLSSYLPSSQLVANSERYLVGPVGLAKFDPEIPPSTAAFHLGAEAQMGTFRSAKSEMKLAIFSYPTPQIARERLVDFQRISGAVAKRAGPLVAVILSPPNADEAERLLAQVRYEPSITWSEHVPTARDNIGNLIINVFELIGIVIIFCTVAGLSVGGLRSIIRRAGPGGEAESMIVLHLTDR